jgi:hypothetical protein
MKHFVQLKDEVVFAFHSSSTEVDIPGDNIIQVESDGEKYINQKYVNGSFVDAPLIKYAVIDEDNDNTVISIDSTRFLSNVKGPIINNNDVKVLWKWNGTDFVAPITVSPAEVTIIPVEIEEEDPFLPISEEPTPTPTEEPTEEPTL